MTNVSLYTNVHREEWKEAGEMVGIVRTNNRCLYHHLQMEGALGLV
jgi:hypothetical protein